MVQTPPVILALDLGKHLGFAVYDNGSVYSGGVNLKVGPDTPRGRRFSELESFLDDFLSIDRVAYERVNFASRTPGRNGRKGGIQIYSLQTLFGLYGVLDKWIYENHKGHQDYEVPSIKKHWTGSGNARKEAMIAEAERRGFVVKNDNQADALAVLDCDLALYGLTLWGGGATRKIDLMSFNGRNASI